MNVVALKNIGKIIEQGKSYPVLRTENGNYVFEMDGFEIGFSCDNFVEEYLLEII
jgi:hypothetical protein